ncbi:hypothetical protein LNP81_08405 [Flavobacterium sp. F-30]|uniref:Uncharacterized protein n=2 Tax=Flavobacterium piscisymbiosum TaxID=2893753 RepID=A0ABS8MBW3_9FLAO|nr:hypothetical protein [Flavobacterium sp. F-30]
MNKLSTIENIGNTNSIFVMAEIKHSTGLEFYFFYNVFVNFSWYFNRNKIKITFSVNFDF